MHMTEAQRTSTLERFHEHRRAWDGNPALRTLYTDWYERIRSELPPPMLGPRVELGSGPGFAKQFIPDLELSDIVRAPWHDRECSADSLPFSDSTLGAVVLFDVLHHLASPRTFFREAIRALRPGGRIVMCEPYVSPLSYPVYKFMHEEPTILRGIDPLADQVSADPRDPFDSNQAIPTLLFGRRRAEFETAFPELAILRVEHMSSLSYPASGGFSHRPFLPSPLWFGLHRLESKLPSWLVRWAAFRMLVTIERR
jgi:SAM-dependent methyltransferase